MENKMEKEYVIDIDRVMTTFYSISRDDALTLIGEEWDEEVKQKCKANEAILDMYMTKYAQRVKLDNEVTDIHEHFYEHDIEYGVPINLRLSTYTDDDTNKVLVEMSDEEDDEDGE